MELSVLGHLAGRSAGSSPANVHSRIGAHSSGRPYDGVLACTTRVRVANDRAGTEPFRLSARVQNVLRVHSTRVKSGSFVGCQCAAEAILTARNLHRLVLHVVIGLGPHFLALYVLRIEVALRRVEVLARAVPRAVLRSSLLIALRRGVNNEVIFVLFGNGRLSLVNHEEVVDGAATLLLPVYTLSTNVHVRRDWLVRYLRSTHWRRDVHGLQRRHLMRGGRRADV